MSKPERDCVVQQWFARRIVGSKKINSLYFLKNIVLRPERQENNGKREKIEVRQGNSRGCRHEAHEGSKIGFGNHAR